jgi:phosphoribosylamine--glycine ligase
LTVAAGSAAVVTLASRGYPDAYGKGFPIRGIEEACERPGTLVFHSGTRTGSSGPLTDGGRVLGVVGIGTDLREALTRAYEGVGTIDFEGKTFRTDIGKRGLEP